MTRAGQLRHSIVIQEPTRTANADGQMIDSWGTYLARRANVIPVSGNEKVGAGKRLEATITHTIELRSDVDTRDITTKMRVLYDSRYLNIRRAYDVDGRRRTIMLECEERA